MNETVRRVTTHAGDPAWLVTNYRTVRRLLSDPRLGRTHPDPERASRLSDSLIFGRPQPTSPTEHADHVKMRKVLGRSFSARRLTTIEPRVRELADGLLDDLSSTPPPVDFHDAISFPLPALVICELLGVPYEDRDDFRAWSDAAADMTDEARSLSGLASLWQYMNQLLESKRQHPAEDVLSDLAEAYPLDEAARLAAGVLFAGHETTVTAIDKGVVLLLTNAAQRDALQRDPNLADTAVEEVLRCPFPVPAPDTGRFGGLPRYASAEIDIDGTAVHAGELVLLQLQDANLEEELFPRPESFDITRAQNPHLTFGHGPYFCIGAPLARMELRALFGMLFQRFPSLRLAVPVEDLRPRGHLLTGGLERLPVTW